MSVCHRRVSQRHVLALSLQNVTSLAAFRMQRKNVGKQRRLMVADLSNRTCE